MNAKALLSNVVTSACVCSAMFFAHDRWIAEPAPRLGVVDVASVYRLKEKQLVDMVTPASATEDDRKKAASIALEFGNNLPAALDDLSRECACLVLVNHAIAGGARSLADLTPALSKRLGL